MRTSPVALVPVCLAILVSACGGGAGAPSSAGASTIASLPTTTGSSSPPPSAAVPSEAASGAPPTSSADLKKASAILASHTTWAVHCEQSPGGGGDEEVQVVEGLVRAKVTVAGAGSAPVYWKYTDAHHFMGVSGKDATSVAVLWSTACSPTWAWDFLVGTGAATKAALVGSEQKNGIAAVHYQVVSAGQSIDLWVAEADGAALAIETPNGKVEVSRIDDPTIKVDMPPG